MVYCISSRRNPACFYSSTFELLVSPQQSECGVLTTLWPTTRTSFPNYSGPGLGCLHVPGARSMNLVSQRNTMTSHPYIFINKTPEQLRLLGARGGRVFGRNHRARSALTPPPPPAPPAALALESTAAVIAKLDAQFPWLRSAEKPQSAGNQEKSRWGATT